MTSLPYTLTVNGQIVGRFQSARQATLAFEERKTGHANVHGDIIQLESIQGPMFIHLVS